MLTLHASLQARRSTKGGVKAGKAKALNPPTQFSVRLADVAISLPSLKQNPELVGQLLQLALAIIMQQKLTAKDENLETWDAFLLACMPRLRLDKPKAKKAKVTLEQFFMFYQFEEGATSKLEAHFTEKRAAYFDAKHAKELRDQAREEKKRAREEEKRANLAKQDAIKKLKVRSMKYECLLGLLFNHPDIPTEVSTELVNKVNEQYNGGGYYIESSQEEPDTPPCEAYTPEGTPEPCDQSPPASYGGHTPEHGCETLEW